MKTVFHLFCAICVFTMLACDKKAESPKDSATSERTVTQTLDSSKNVTKLQQFLGKRGTLLIKDFYNLGTVNGNYSSKMELKAVVFFEPGKETERMRGLKIDISSTRSYGDNTESAFLDLEELQSLAQALHYMIELDTKWSNIPKEYTEVIFETRGNFKAGFYKKENAVTPFVSAGYGSGANCFFEKAANLSLVAKKIEEGIALLNGK